VVTAASLLVSTVDAMTERCRPTVVLSALGLPAGVIRKSIMSQIALSLSIALALGVVIGLAMTALVFRIYKQPLLLPLRPLTLTATAVGAGVMVASASALPWVRITCRPELLRME
jgi:predicted lysophospholipase L1 biosynthesis ABC-type transport system permease subunit